MRDRGSAAQVALEITNRAAAVGGVADDRSRSVPCDGVAATLTRSNALAVESSAPQNLACKGARDAPQGMLVFDIDFIKIEPPITSRF